MVHRYLSIILFLSFTASCFPHPANKPEFKTPKATGFIENKGQIIDQKNNPNHAVLYLLNTPGMNVQLRTGGFSYDVYSIENKPNPNHLSIIGRKPYQNSLQSDSLIAVYHYNRVDFDFEGINSGCEIIPYSPSSDYLNYYTTGTSAKGFTLVRLFRTITYKNIYPGIDLIFTGDGPAGFKYNFIVRPEGDIHAIRIKINGPDIKLNANGSLLLTTSVGNIEEEIPHSFFKSENNIPVRCTFRKTGVRTFGIETEHNIDGKILIIDPVPRRVWATYYGGSNYDVCYVTMSPDGNIILSGRTSSTNNIATSGSFQSTYGGGSMNLFIAKLTPACQRLWGTYFGDLGSEMGRVCKTDNLGNIYISGNADSLSTNLASAGAYQTSVAGASDCFVGKFNSSGFRVWSTYYGGQKFESGGFCSVDNNGNVYLCGETNSTNGIATTGSHQPNFGGAADAFLVKFDSSGQRLWGTYYGGSFWDDGMWCAVDANDHVILCGGANSPTNIATAGSFQPNLGNPPTFNLGDGFLVLFNGSGQRQWGTYYGGTGWDVALMCEIGSDQSIYITGETESSNAMSSSNGFQPVFGGNQDDYVAKFNMSGGRSWGTYYGGTGYEGQAALAVDDSLNVFLCGSSNSSNNIATPNAFQTVNMGSFDLFLVKFDSSCHRKWGTYYGDTTNDGCLNCEVSGDTIYLAGAASNSYRLTTPDSYQPLFGGGLIDGLLVKFADCYSPDTVDHITGVDTLCVPQTWETFSIAPMPFATSYLWEFPPGASITSGQGTNTVTVDFGINAVSGLATVSGVNTCGPGEPNRLYLHLKPRPTPIIIGDSLPCLGTSKSYTTQNGKSSYQWSLSSGGLLNSGGTVVDDYATVIWTGAGAQWISVNYMDTNNCEALNPVVHNVTVSPPQTVNVIINASNNPICSGTLVTFTATPTNPGTNPDYQWKVNGGIVGSNNPIYSYTPNNGDVVSCVLTSDALCVIGNPATSNTDTMTVNPNLPVNVSISASANPFCQGASVTFTATPTNGGGVPTYQWKVNGVGVGPDNPVYSFSPNNGDVVSCVMHSSIACPTGNPATSNTITMVENTNSPVSVSINATANPVCNGISVTYTAIPTNGGTIPVYQWKVNGIIVGTINPGYTYPPINGDIILCILTSNLFCASGNPATSNTITMTVNPNMPVSIIINASANPVCVGTQVIFTANPINPGTLPFYQWKVNGINAGANNLTYSYIPINGDVVKCILTSNAICPTGNPATSNTLVMTVNPNLPVGITITASNNPVCAGIPVTFTATPANGGLSPSYQWKVNGISVGTNITTYQFIPGNGDLINCILTSSVSCPTGNPATSNTITMNISSLPIVTYTLCNDSITTTNAQPFKLKGGIPLGGTYSGTGVTNGIFYPGIAGVGIHQINYTYINAALCAVTDHRSLITINPAPFTCGNLVTDIRDNKVYQTVHIGSQCWLAEDLNYGVEIPPDLYQRDNCIPEKYHNPASSIQHPASVYQWDEIMNYDETLSNQGLCPPGWHVPSEPDWNILFANYINNGFAASPLKHSGFSGFNALLSGTRHLNKTWDYQGFATFFWSSTAHGPMKAWSHGMNDLDPSVSAYPSYRNNAFSVRCLRDN